MSPLVAREPVNAAGPHCDVPAGGAGVHARAPACVCVNAKNQYRPRAEPFFPSRPEMTVRRENRIYTF